MIRVISICLFRRGGEILVTEGLDTANNQRLLAELAPLPDDRRNAYYVCAAALADPQGTIRAVVEGRCHGVLTKQCRGTGGFGYDPVFVPTGYDQSFGELSTEIKNRLSHRAKALEKVAQFVATLKR